MGFGARLDSRMTKSWNLLLVVLCGVCVAGSARPGDEGPVSNVTAIMESEVTLPCNVTTNYDDDKPVLIMFYRNDSGTPIYTVDLRDRKRSQAKHLPLLALRNRATFDLHRGRSGLKFRTVWSSDDGLYRCRVDFKVSPTRNSWIHLSVVVPPDSVRIVDETDSEKSSMIGPYVLGQTLTLKCIAKGGRPPPKLTWWGGSEEIRGTLSVITTGPAQTTSNGAFNTGVYSSPAQRTPSSTKFHGKNEVTTASGSTKIVNTLTIPSLQRHHLHQSFVCNAANSDLEKAVPITAAVIVDMTLPPMSISLTGINGPVSANVGKKVTCRVVGARPLPTVTFWLDGRPIKPNSERSSQDGNVTESTLLFTPTAEDQGRFLSCRAETPGLLQGKLEDGVKLEVHYLPVANISLGPRLNRHNIKEGDDVYFTCSIHASPPPDAVHWFHDNIHLSPNSSSSSSVSTTGGVLVSNVSLLVHSVGRRSMGEYSCRATNAEGTGSSKPFHLDVKYSPICRSAQKWQYGIAYEEQAKILCEVDANPQQVAFQWTFNNSAEIRRLPESSITNNWTTSELTYTPRSSLDYGLLTCQASNTVGRQREPCFYTIFPAGPPDPLQNCSVVNESLDSVRVQCTQGFNGGLPQSFVMEVYETEGNKLRSNVTSKSPSFAVSRLQSGLRLTIKLYAANSKGKSAERVLKAFTLGDSAEKQTSILRASELPSTMELHPSLPIILGVIGGIVIVFVVFVVVLVAKRPRRNSIKNSINQEDSRMHILKKDDSPAGRQEGDERDPDVIPESRGSRVDCGNDHNHPQVADVSTLYGEMMTQQSSTSSAALPQNSAAPVPIPATNAHIHNDPAMANSNPSQQQQPQPPSSQQLSGSVVAQQPIVNNQPSTQEQQQQQPQHQQQHILVNPQHVRASDSVQQPPHHVHMSMSVHSPSSPCSPQIVSPRILNPSPMSPASPQPNSLPPQLGGAFQPQNCVTSTFYHQPVRPNQGRLQHTQSLQHNHVAPPPDQDGKLHHQQSLPERSYFSPSANTYANAHLLNKNKSLSVSVSLPQNHANGLRLEESKHGHNFLQQSPAQPPPHQQQQQPLQQQQMHQHYQQQNIPKQINHRSNHQDQSQHAVQQQQNQPKHHKHHHHHHHHGQQQQQPLPSRNDHSGSRSSLLSGMGAGSTQTLPHPRSQQKPASSVVNTATLGRRASLFIDPLTTPIAPPAPYATPPSSLVDSGDGTVVVAETICITPNYGHSNACPTQDAFSSTSKPFPSSFSTDRMESSV